jgi:hypothetical protein
MTILKNDVPMLEKWMGDIVAETQGHNNAFLAGAVFENMEPADAEVVVITKAETAAPVIPLGGEIPNFEFEESEKVFRVDTVGKSNIILDREAKGSYEGLLARRVKAIVLSVDEANEVKIYDEIVLATAPGSSQLLDASTAGKVTLEVVSQLQAMIKDEYQDADMVLVINKQQYAVLKSTPGFNFLTGDSIGAVAEIFGVKLKLSKHIKANEAILYVVEDSIKAKYQQDRGVVLSRNDRRMGYDIFAPCHRIIGVRDETLVARASFTEVVLPEEVPAG